MHLAIYRHTTNTTVPAGAPESQIMLSNMKMDSKGLAATAAKLPQKIQEELSF